MNDGKHAEPRAALAALEPFSQRLLPGMLRRHSSWRGIAEDNRSDLLADVRQELRLDCLQHAAAILALPERERHQRWFRLVERWVYRHRRRGAAGAMDLAAATVAAPVEPEPTPQDLRAMLPGVPQATRDALVRRNSRYHNGRCNLTATAASVGMSRAQLRSLWERAADRAGYGNEFLAFWQRRLAEALLGLAADLLADRGVLRLWPRPRPRPDPEGRLRRIRRIHAILLVRPVPFPLRRLLARVLRAGADSLPRAQELLAAAADLDPGNTAVALWQFEAACADGDLAAAAYAIAAARTAGADRSAVALARARLLDARGRTAAAAAFLRRALRRLGPDPRLSLALERVLAAP